MARSLIWVWAFTAVGCSMIPSQPLTPIVAAHRVDPFMGVTFGDSFDDVERRFPTGLAQTSPYGAPALKLENVSAHGIEYQDVIYEFAGNAGMQLVIAHFTPSASEDLYQQLQGTLGAPNSSDANIDGSARAGASWKLSDGSRVLFDGSHHRLVLIGNNGASLETDIHLRDQFIPTVS